MAHEFTVGDLTIDHAMAFETAVSAKSGGGYLSITNNGTTGDRLIAVKAAFPRVMLHTTEEKDGIARMMHIEAVDIPAGQTVALAPGGMHVMFMGLNGDPFEVGEKVPATLVFEKSGEVDVEFSVKARTQGETSTTNHSGHAVKN